jgi:multidrug resistance efflux pump
MRGKWALISAAAILALGGAALLLKHRQKPVPVPRQVEAAVIHSDDVTLNGPIRPQHVIGVGATVSGNIDALLVDVGEDVFEGQLLARTGSSNLDSDREAATQVLERTQDQLSKAESAVNSTRLEASRADADMQRARAQLDRTQAVLEHQTTLHKAGATPKLVYEKAVTDYEGAVKEFEIMDKALRASRDNASAASTKVAGLKSAVAEKSRDLDNTEGAYTATEVHAPSEGVVVGRKGETGKPAQEYGDQLFQIATDLYALEVTLPAKPEVLKRIHPGQPATVQVLDLQSLGMPGAVKEVREKEGEIVVEFSGTVSGIRPGMRADVRLRLE